MLDDRLGQLHFWITFLGTYAIYFPMHYLGVLGMPRRYYDYDGLPVHPAVGARAERVHHRGRADRRRGAAAVHLQPGVERLRAAARPDANPWRAASLEWLTPRHAARRTATGGRSCRWSTAGPMPTACRARSEDFIAQNAPPEAGGHGARAVRRQGRAGKGAHGMSTATAAALRMPARAPDADAPRAASIGLWVFMGVATALFSLFLSAYVMRMDGSDAVAARAAVAAVAQHGAAGRRQRGAAARRAAARGARARGRAACCWPAALCALAFLGGAAVGLAGAAGAQRDAGRQSGRQLLLPADGDARPARGRAAWSAGPGRRAPPGARPPSAAWRIGLCARYWHFLLRCGSCCSPRWAG